MQATNPILMRLPGGVFWKSYINSFSLRSEKWQFLHQLFKELYFHGGSKTQTSKIFEDAIKTNFLVGNIIDFGIIKIAMDSFIAGGNAICYELCDLIFPYLTGIDCCIEGCYEKNNVIVTEGDVVIDAGANLGLFSIFAAKQRGAFVYAFEPVGIVRKYLKENIVLNGCDDMIEVVPYALSDMSGKIDMLVDAQNIGGGTMVYSAMGNDRRELQTTEVVTLDEYVLNNKLERVDFIKADIEGAERLLLAGATQVLAKYRPRLAICTYHLPDDRKVLTKIIMDANPSYNITYGPMKLYAY